MTNVFEEVRARVPTRRVALDYGLQIDRNSVARCPFHNDSHPSMKIYNDGFKCFACGAHGDSVTLVAKLLDCKPIEAAQDINRRYGLGLSIGQPETAVQRRQRLEAQRAREAAQAAEQADQATVSAIWRAWLDIRRLYHRWVIDFEPTGGTLDNADPRYIEAIQNIDTVDYILDRLETDGTQDKLQSCRDFQRRLNKTHERIGLLQA